MARILSTVLVVIMVLASCAVRSGGELGSTTTPRSLAEAQGIPFEPARLVQRTDSFDLIVGGQRRGHFVHTLSREREFFRLRTDFVRPALMAQEAHDIVFLATTLMPVAHNVRSSARGTTYQSEVSIVNGHARGIVAQPGPAGAATMNLDLAVPAGTVDDEALHVLLYTLPIAESYTASFTTFDVPPGHLLETTVRAVARESVRVPAGAYETWRVMVEQRGESLPTIAFLTVSEPRRIVLLQSGGVELRYAGTR